METKRPNPSIKCTVEKCKHHCNGENYCGLDTVDIATHERDPKVCQCVDCESFVAKS